MVLVVGVLVNSPLKAAERLPLLAEIPMPGNHLPFDVRWTPAGPEEAGGDEAATMLLVAQGTEGVIRLRPEKAHAPEVVLAGDRRPGVGFFYTTELAVSAGAMVASAPIGGLTWVDLDTGRRGPDFGQRVIVDVDLHGDRLLLLGVRDGEKGEWSPDGAIAWIGSISQQLKDLRPVAYSETEHSEGMARCAFFDHGAARFLSDGSFVLVPGAEPGIFLYDSKGRLRQTWDAKEIGVDTGCGPSTPKTFAQFAKDWKLRHTAFLNKHRIVEDVVELTEGPALLVRQVESGVLRWYLKVLPRAGQKASIYLLPIHSTTLYAGAQADAREGVLAIAVGDSGETGMSGDIPQKLFLVELPGASAKNKPAKNEPTKK